ncbi:MAG: hypothetical protein H0W83_07640 [Planctomycetes bacterium]|nr:hypothetical protein [Planctomycetota bacterium]
MKTPYTLSLLVAAFAAVIPLASSQDYPTPSPGADQERDSQPMPSSSDRSDTELNRDSMDHASTLDGSKNYPTGTTDGTIDPRRTASGSQSGSAGTANDESRRDNVIDSPVDRGDGVTPDQKVPRAGRDGVRDGSAMDQRQLPRSDGTSGSNWVDPSNSGMNAGGSTDGRTPDNSGNSSTDTIGDGVGGVVGPSGTNSGTTSNGIGAATK